MKTTFHFSKDGAEVFLHPENERDQLYLNLIKSCEDKAIIVPHPDQTLLAIAFKERKLES